MRMLRNIKLNKNIFQRLRIRTAVARSPAGNPKAVARAAVETLRHAADGGHP